MVDLSKLELFQELLYIEDEGKGYDLHNEYDCTGFTYDQDNFSLILNFVGSNHAEPSINGIVKVEFSQVIFLGFNFNLSRTADSSTINNFYRGRFEMNGEILEVSDDGSSFFYIEFETGDRIELLAKKATFIVGG